jgi:hypothetical protein
MIPARRKMSGFQNKPEKPRRSQKKIDQTPPGNLQFGFSRLAVSVQLEHRDFWSGRWESNCEPKF